MMSSLVMRRAALAAITALAAGILAGCGSTTETATGRHPDMASSHTAATSAPSGSRTPVAFNDADVMFAQMMIPHHRQAVDMAELAATRAGDAHVKKLAATIRAAQEPEITAMTGWLRTWGAPTTTPTAGHDGMEHGDMPGLLSSQEMAALEAASGKDFDRRFLTGMIAHHEGAISMARQEIRDGADPAAKALAQQIATSQQREVEEMKEILARL
ncbi:DUF305 domain-containing protein [Nonomuraea maheshkhaliensis]|uniref:DUF305 domain-containing protein n=1 Tax=Nonomuraea maheshkhaliensis TaxID=419590 RepID=A0ABN2F2Y6_9ACTN